MSRLAKKLSTLCAAVLLASGAHAANFSDASLSYLYLPKQSEPGVSDEVKKNILNFTYVSGDNLGLNLFSIDLLKSDAVDPSNNGGSGAQEWYGFYQRSFSLSAMTGNKGGYGPFKDISLTARVDAGTKNTAFAPSPRKLRLGANVDMPVSAGFWTVGLSAYKESNHNGIVGTSVSFDVAPVLDSAWSIPVGGIGAFTGFLSIVGPKGKDGFGEETKTETLARALFMFDVLGAKSGLKVGVGVEYWKNKFGANNSTSFVKDSAKATTPVFVLQYTL